MIEKNAFYLCSSLTEITFVGKKADWDMIQKDKNWINSALVVKCLDGTINETPIEEI